MDLLTKHHGGQFWARPGYLMIPLVAVLVIGVVLVLLTGSRFGLFVQSVGIASGIGLLATILSIPIARVLMAVSVRGRWIWPIALVPMWMPSYAIYGAMNLARAPDTIVGHWLISYATSDPSRRWATVWAGYAVGVVGLSLWGSVIAAVAFVSTVSSKGRAESMYGDMIALEPAGFWVRGRLWVGIHRQSLFVAWGIVTVIMLGSSVPLHLAQFQTWSIVIWRELSERGPERWGEVWVMGSPMVVVGLVGAWLVTWVVLRSSTSRGSFAQGVFDSGVSRTGTLSGRSSGSVGLLGAGIVWSLAVLLPIGVLAISIDDWRALPMFWSERRDALVHSGWIGLAVGGVAFVFSVCIAFAFGHWNRMVRGLGVAAIFLSTAGALMPGVLVGAWIVRMMPPSSVSEVFGLLTRTLVVAGIVGAVSAQRESGELLSQRWSMGATGLKAWWVAHGQTTIAPCLGAGILCGLLGIHEVETSVMMTQAGVSTLSQTLLADLHYARLERLSAALLNIMGLAVVLSVLAGWLVSRSSKSMRE